MASAPERRAAPDGATTWRVVWREDGVKQSETFAGEADAAEFRRLGRGAWQHLAERLD